eukprot:g19744.t1
MGPQAAVYLGTVVFPACKVWFPNGKPSIVSYLASRAKPPFPDCNNYPINIKPQWGDTADYGCSAGPSKRTDAEASIIENKKKHHILLDVDGIVEEDVEEETTVPEMETLLYDDATFGTGYSVFNSTLSQQPHLIAGFSGQKTDMASAFFAPRRSTVEGRITFASHHPKIEDPLQELIQKGFFDYVSFK